MNDTRPDSTRQDQEDRLAAIAQHYAVLVTRRGVRIPCPAHRGRDPNLALWVAEKGYVRAYCHSEKCAFGDVAAAILADSGVNLFPPNGSPGRRPNKDFEVARYYHPDGKPRISYRKDYPFDFPPGPCTYRKAGSKDDCGRVDPHKHPWTNKGASYAGVHPKVWGEDPGDGPLVLCEGEKAAKAVQDAGYVAVSLFGGAHHADKADYGLLTGRSVIIWPDQDNAGEGFAHTASYHLGRAHAGELRFVSLDQCPKGDAADVDPERRANTIADVLAGPPTPPVDSEPSRVQTAADPFDVGMFGDLAPDGDAGRYMGTYAHLTVVKRYEQMEGSHEATKAIAGILNPTNGLWTFDEATIDIKIKAEALKEWQRVRDNLTPRPDSYTQKRLTYLGQISAHPGPARSRIPIVAGEPTHPDYKLVTFAHESQFDQPGRYLGCANGVVDLETGRLLPPDLGRRCLVTRSTGVEYHEDASHKFVDVLFSHLDTDSSDFILSVLGRALWGVPDNTFVLILGPTQAGKTTLMAAVSSAIGGYFGSMNIDALQNEQKGNAKSAHTEAIRALFDKRIVSLPESERGRVSPATLKALTDGAELQPERSIFSRARERHVTGTMFILANAPPKLGLNDTAVRTRFRAVEYPSVPADRRDPRVKAAFTPGTRDPKAAEAMLALLVRYTGLNPPGTDLAVPPSVQAFTDTQIDTSFTEFERWLQGRLAYVRDRRVAVNDVWEAWAKENGKDSDNEEIGGQKREGLPAAIVRSSNVVPGLPPVKRARFGPHQWGWIDYAVVTPGVEDVGQGQRMDLDGVKVERGTCQDCGKPTDSKGKLCDACLDVRLRRTSQGGAGAPSGQAHLEIDDVLFLRQRPSTEGDGDVWECLHVGEDWKPECEPCRLKRLSCEHGEVPQEHCIWCQRQAERESAELAGQMKLED